MTIIDDTLLTQVADEAKKSPRLRMNYIFHQSLQDKCHRFLNALEPGTRFRDVFVPQNDNNWYVVMRKNVNCCP